jgi:hypothetical protein
MRRLTIILATVTLMLAAVMPVLADEGDPLAESLLLPGTLGAAMAALAGILVLVFFLMARRARR